MSRQENKVIAFAATAIVWLSLATIWIAENGSPFRNQGLSGDSSE